MLHLKKIIFLSILLLFSVIYLPEYLVYSDKLTNADSIIVFEGSPIESRVKEAKRLFLEGYSKKIIIPSNGLIIENIDRMSLRKVRRHKKEGYIIIGKDKPDFYENTHIEMLNVKKNIETYNFKSLIFVSSPFHMRRLKIISGKVLADNKLKIIFVPSRFEKAYTNEWFSHWNKIQWVVSEYVKIGWFLLYEPWVEN